MREPELRRFEADPVETAKSKRPELAVAALTILRAFHAAGRPEPEGVAPLGGFEDWSLLVRNALIWVGCADPVASQEKLRKDDPDKTELEDVMTQWLDVFGGDRATVAEVIESACELEPYAGYSANTKFARPLFRDALLAVAGAGGAVNGKRLGKWLKRNKGRIVGGVRFQQAEQLTTGAIWRLVKDANLELYQVINTTKPQGFQGFSRPYVRKPRYTVCSHRFYGGSANKPWKPTKS
jgi:putative DNA primase/helicase